MLAFFFLVSAVHNQSVTAVSYCYDLFLLELTSLVTWWSELLTTNHEVPGSIPGSTMCVFP